MNRFANFILISSLLSGAIIAHAESDMLDKKPYIVPQEIQCIYTHEGNLRCTGMNHNYLLEVLPIDFVTQGEVKTYTFYSARTSSTESLQPLLIYKDSQTQKRIAIQTSYLPISADVNNKKSAWVLEKGKQFYLCEGHALDCPITDLPY